MSHGGRRARRWARKYSGPALLGVGILICALALPALLLRNDDPPPSEPMAFAGAPAIGLGDEQIIGDAGWWVAVCKGLPEATLPCTTRGESGATLSMLTETARRITASGVQPRLVFVELGTADLAAGMSPAQVKAGVRSLLDELPRGATPVLVSSLPIRTTLAGVTGLNTALSDTADERGADYLDLTGTIISADGAWLPGYGVTDRMLTPVTVAKIADLAKARVSSDA